MNDEEYWLLFVTAARKNKIKCAVLFYNCYNIEIGFRYLFLFHKKNKYKQTLPIYG